MGDMRELRLGLLDAVPREYYLPGEKSDPQKFIDLFDGISAPFAFETYEITAGRFPAKLDECDAWLITGSPCSVYDRYDWIPEAEAFIRAAHADERPLAGVCFGHQLIAEALGGEVRLADRGWLVGLHDFEVRSPREWMTDRASSHALYFINQDQVVSLPDGAVHLAGSAACPNAMYTIGDHVLGLQAHPEQPLASMRAFVGLLRDRYGVDAQVCEQALASMDGRTPDAALVGGWISAFLQSACGVAAPASGNRSSA